jgi:hypothetical protein
MKLLILIGGIGGFAIGLGFGLAAQNAWPMSVWQACLGTYIAAFLMRWWGRVWMQSLKQSYRERLASVAKQTSPPALTHTKP